MYGNTKEKTISSGSLDISFKLSISMTTGSLCLLVSPLQMTVSVLQL